VLLRLLHRQHSRTGFGWFPGAPRPSIARRPSGSIYPAWPQPPTSSFPPLYRQTGRQNLWRL